VTPQRWSRMKEIFGAALEMPEPERPAFLDSACAGDAELRAEVERLLAESSTPSLHSPARGLLNAVSLNAAGELAPGDTVAHYRIEAELGEGGMGMVYKARDTSLNRLVAIKLIRSEGLGDEDRDEDRMRRFTQEARTASGLNHPNIVTIYEISTHDGTPVIVMEYVPGKPLDRLIPRHGMRLGEVLKIGGQMAGALAAAAAAGVIHRDMKPGNVMVTDAGNVKVLDFGLAKLYERVASAAEDTERPHTREGAILGTASYMSPEQAEGKTVDPRSDIFSFGAVLYEMTTGQRAFRGETTLSTLSAILRDEPKPVSQLASGIPRDLEKIITRCLRKDPERRFQNMADVRVALQELKEEAESGRLPQAAVAQARKRVWMWVAAAALLVVALLGLWQAKRFATPALQQKVVPVTTYAGTQIEPCFSPDGNQVAFSWDGEKGDNFDIYVKMIGEANALRLTTDPAPDAYPAWSPDGRRIAFQRSGPNGGIYTTSPFGGGEQKLTDFPASGQMSWSPDGKWLAVSSRTGESSGIFLLPMEAGEPRRISNPKAATFDVAPSISRDGRLLAYAACSGPAGAYNCDISVQDLGSADAPQGSPRRVTNQRISNVHGLSWSREDESLIFDGSPLTLSMGCLWRLGIHDQRSPQRIEIAGPRAIFPSIASAGKRLVFVKYLQDYDIWRYHTGGGMEPLIVSSLYDGSPQFSPDGTRIAFVSERSGEEREVWVARADGSGLVQLTNRLGRKGTPRWSPDGRWIVFDSQGQDGHWHTYVIDASGGRPRRITSEPSDDHVPSWSRDGKWIYFESDRTGRAEIWRASFAGGAAERVTANGGFEARESVDGKTLFYVKANSSPLFAQPLPGGPERQVLPWVSYRAFEPVEDGIYYIGWQRDDRTFPLEFFQYSSKTKRLLAKIDGYVNVGLSVSPDRQTILFTKTVSHGANLMMIENF
jgi:Tol biopolymer transport system component/tRNA A-37 threonylcarbamoyl transferase component Bud32